MAVLPLAALATFETVPGVPLAVARSLRGAGLGPTALRARGRARSRRRPGHPAAADRRACRRCAFADASLRYGPGLPRALDGVSLRLPAGGRVAVTGSSGAGKSSLVTALLRYWPLEDGTLSLGGTDVRGPAPGRRAGRLRAGRPAGADVRRHGAVQPRPRPARRHRGGDHRRAAHRSPARPGWPPCPRGSTRRSARTASPSPVASAGAWRWPAPCWHPDPSWCSTSPPAASTLRWPTSSWTACWPPPGSGACWSSPTGPPRRRGATWS